MIYPKQTTGQPKQPKHAAEPISSPGVASSPSFSAIERGVLAFWQQDDTFRESIRQREGCEEWVFNDGPPFANGLPHYGHLLTGYAKDV
ncbi:MAG: class I tRNA ligase family protein, partial [Leucobacter sp.]|nr:class I tRNA ligase family protein [Leucobacter sp.]